MQIGTITAFWAVSFLLVLTPGADWAYAIAAGLKYRSVLPAVAGLLSGHAVATLIVAAGVATLVAQSPAILIGLTVLGAAYLIWLGIGTLRHPPKPHAAKDGQREDSALRQFLKGAGISGLNPKVFLLFLALLPQFTNPQAPLPIAAQIVILGAIHITSCAAIYTAVGITARRVLSTRPTIAQWVSRISGTAMVAIGAVLLTQQIVQ